MVNIITGAASIRWWPQTQVNTNTTVSAAFKLYQINFMERIGAVPRSLKSGRFSCMKDNGVYRRADSEVDNILIVEFCFCFYSKK